MTTPVSNMDKNKQFQIRMLTNKLKDYSERLVALESKKQNLIDNQVKDKHDKYIYKFHKNIFLQEHTTITNNINKLKVEQNQTRSDKMLALNNIKLLPNIRDSNIENEKAIYLEECKNIDAKLIEEEEKYQDNMKQQVIDKQLLEEEINSIQDEINNATTNITNLQENAHAFRKNTISQLHEQKQQKKAIHEEITKLKDIENLHHNNKYNLTTENNNLQSLKQQLINYYYLTSESTSKSTSESQHTIINILEPINTVISISTDKSLEFISNNLDTELNNIINIIDTQIQSNERIIKNTEKQINKLTVNNNTVIRHLTTDRTNRNRYRVLSYKDSYKQAKMEKNMLESKLQELQSVYNDWDSCVVNKLGNDNREMLAILEADKLRANERLSIMNDRYNEEYRKQKDILEERKQHHENKLLNITNQLNELTVKLENTNKKLDSLDITQTEINKIDTAIVEITNSISIIEHDLASLQS